MIINIYYYNLSKIYSSNVKNDRELQKRFIRKIIILRIRRDIKIEVYKKRYIFYFDDITLLYTS